MTPREKAIEWIELAQAGAEVGIAYPAMRVAVLQNLTQAIELLQTSPAPSNPESAATEGDFIDKFLSQMSTLTFDGEKLEFWDKSITLQFVDDVRKRLTERSESTRVVSQAAIDFEIRSHLGAEQDKFETMLRHQLGLAIYKLQLRQPVSDAEIAEAVNSVRTMTAGKMSKGEFVNEEWVNKTELLDALAKLQGAK